MSSPVQQFLTTSDSLGPGADDLHDLREGVGEDGEAADDEEDDEYAAEVCLGGDVPVADGGHGDDHVVEGGEVGQVGVGVVLVVVPRVPVVLQEEAQAGAEEYLQGCEQPFIQSAESRNLFKRDLPCDQHSNQFRNARPWGTSHI